MSRFKSIAAIAFVLAVAIGGYFTLMPTAHAGSVFTGKTPGVAINGYDPVGYFKQNEPVMGSSAHAHSWNGVEWHFATAENRDTFAADPQRYAPQYGGYCALAAAKDYLAKTEPDAFTIYDGKLYLNYDKGIKRRWDGNREDFIEAATKYWPGLEEKARAE